MRAVMRIAAAIDYLHGEFRLCDCDRITGDMWAEAFKACGSEPNFYENGVDVGLTDNMLQRGLLIPLARGQFRQLTMQEWRSLGL